MPPVETIVPHGGTALHGRTGLSAAPVAVGARDVPAAEKVLHVLAAFERSKCWSLGGLARAVDLPKSTVHRLLASLCTVGFVQQEQDNGDYRLGPRAWGLGGRSDGTDTLVEIAMPTLRGVRTEVGESTFLTVQEGSCARCVARVNAEQEVAVLISQGASSPLHLGASNTILLAFLPQEERRDWLDRTIDDEAARDRIEQELRAIETAGYAYSSSQLTPGAAAIGVPVRGASGRVLAGLSIGAPAYRLSRERALELLPILAHAGAAISRRFGFRAFEQDGR